VLTFSQVTEVKTDEAFTAWTYDGNKYIYGAQQRKNGSYIVQYDVD